jgi:hypothetical protein
MNRDAHQTLVDIAIVLLVPAIILGAFYAIKSADDSPLFSVKDGVEEDSTRGEVVREALATLRGIELDATFFDSPAFQKLVEYPVTLPTPSFGRENPFVPSGVRVVPVSGTRPSQSDASRRLDELSRGAR